MIGSNIFDRLGLASAEDDLYKSKEAKIDQMLLGDQGHFPNYEDYRTYTGEYGLAFEPWQGENVVKVGPNLYWGHGGGSPKSHQQWEAVLRKEFNGLARRLGKPTRSGSIPEFSKPIKVVFLNVAKIGSKLFDERNK